MEENGQYRYGDSQQNDTHLHRFAVDNDSIENGPILSLPRGHSVRIVS